MLSLSVEVAEINCQVPMSGLGVCLSVFGSQEIKMANARINRVECFMLPL